MIIALSPKEEVIGPKDSKEWLKFDDGIELFSRFAT